MKIIQANAGALTNFEVLDFLRSRGAANDPTRVIASVAQSEYKVYDYLEQSAACTQTREVVADFVEKSRKYNLAKADLINIINIRPSCVPEIHPIEEEWESRWGEDGVAELVELVKEVLPPAPTRTQSEEEDASYVDDDSGGDIVTDGGQQMETS